MREPIIMQECSCKEQNGHYNNNTYIVVQFDFETSGNGATGALSC